MESTTAEKGKNKQEIFTSVERQLIRNGKNPLAEKKNRGYIEDDSDVISIPYVKLLQSTSYEVAEEERNKAGEIINSITKKKISESVLPIFFYKEAILWRARDAGGGILWRRRPPFNEETRKKLEWKNNTSPEAILYLNALVLPDGENFPLVLPFAKTNFKTGKKFYTMAKFSGGDLWENKYRISSQKKGTFFIFDNVVPTGKASEEERMKAEHFYNILSEKIEIDNDTDLYDSDERSLDEDVPF